MSSPLAWSYAAKRNGTSIPLVFHKLSNIKRLIFVLSFEFSCVQLSPVYGIIEFRLHLMQMS